MSTTITVNSNGTTRTYTISDPSTDANIVLTEGSQTINGTKTFTGNLRSTAMFIVMGTAPNSTTIQFNAPSADRVIHLSDPGEDSHFILGDGPQGMSGVMTFANDVIAQTGILIGETATSSAPTTDLHIQGTGAVNVWLEADTDNVTETEQPTIHFTQDNGAIYHTAGMDSNNGFTIALNRSSTTPAFTVATGGVCSGGAPGTLPTVNTPATTRFSITDSGAANFTGDLTCDTEKTDYWVFYGIDRAVYDSGGPVRNNPGDWLLITTGGSDPSLNIGWTIALPHRTGTSKGVKVNTIDVVYSVSTQVLTSVTATLTRVSYTNGVAISRTTIGTSGSLSTAISTNGITKGTITVSSPAYINTATQFLFFDVAFALGASSNLSVRGIYVNYSANYL